MRLLLSLLTLLLPLILSAQNTPKPFEIARQVKAIIRDRHIEPRLIDDAFSRDVFDAFLRDLDPDKKFFTEIEVAELQKFRDVLDDELNLDRWAFLPLVIDSYRDKLQRAEKLASSIGSKPVDLRMNEPWTPRDQFAHSITDLEKRWKSIIAREVMEDMARVSHAGSATDISLTKLEAASREKVLRTHLRRIQKVLQHSHGLENYVANTLFKKYLAVTDPHSVYMSATEMENFIAGLSTNGYDLGLEFQENERGDLVVEGLLPGGPAWNSGEINRGDILEKVRWAGNEWTDATSLELDELDELIAERNHEMIEFAFRQQGGLPRVVGLRKAKVNQEDAIVRAFTLNGKRKVGYINLPDFYSNWGGGESSQSAADVAKEIVKLKQENIEGLILDVRFNGGGSLAEAVAMAGIFIDGGPVGIERERQKEPLTLKDSNRGTVYDGPLVIMVNGLSASASEFLAAALQDYNRAIIVGSNTYGKGVGQQLFSLEPGRSDFKGITPGQRWGYASVTTLRMYRINGRSVQGRGVQPDIELPDLISIFNIREALTPFALKGDSINKKTYPQILKPLPLEGLRKTSAMRIIEHPAFEAISRYRGAVAKYYLAPPVSLSWNHVKHRVDNLFCEFSNLESQLANETQAYVVEPLKFSSSRMQIDQYAGNINTGWIEKLSADHILKETFHIICDYIDTLDKP